MSPCDAIAAVAFSILAWCLLRTWRAPRPVRVDHERHASLTLATLVGHYRPPSSSPHTERKPAQNSNHQSGYT